VEMIGDLIGFGSNEGRGDLVDGPIKLFDAYAVERLGEDGLQAGIDGFPPGEASADVVFPKAGLGFVDAQGNKFPKREAIVFVGKSLLIERMTGLVDAAPGHVVEIVLVDAGRNANVPGVEACSKGVFGEVLAAGLEIEPELPDDVETKVPLPVTGIVAVEETVVDLWPGGNSVEEAFQRRAHGAEHLIEQGGGAAFFEIIEQRVVGVLEVAGEFCLFPFERDEFLQIGFEKREGIGVTGAEPGMEAAGTCFGEVADKSGGKPDLPGIIFQAELNIAALIVSKISALVQLLKEVAEVRCDQPFVRDLGKACQLAAAGCRTFWRKVGLLVPFEHGCGILDIRDFLHTINIDCVQVS